MANNSQPDFANGKICYMEIPATDIRESSKFYQAVFGWRIREDDGGNISFDDTVGQVSGMWILGRLPHTGQGLMVSIMVYDMAETVRLVAENKGRIIQAPEENSSPAVALFSDPAGNVFCLYQHGLVDVTAE